MTDISIAFQKTRDIIRTKTRKSSARSESSLVSDSKPRCDKIEDVGIEEAGKEDAGKKEAMKETTKAQVTPAALGDSKSTADEWDASKTPPSRFQQNRGSVYATPNSRDSHIGRHADRDAKFHELHVKKFGTSKSRSSSLKDEF